MPPLSDITRQMENLKPEDTALLEKTYAFSEKVHRGQKRFSGDPYFTHVFETGKILAELGMGPSCVAAGMLHDILEDGNRAPEEIQKKFGEEILFLIDGVTKLGHLRYRGAERHIGSLQKLFMATSKDLRVLIIKLADRLHNMRTLEFVPKEKQRRIASETLEIYAPLAHRLSMRRVARELENLAFPYVYPEEYKKVKELVGSREKGFTHSLEKFSRSLRKGLAKIGLTAIKTDFRMKSLYSLWKKLARKNTDIESIFDIAALRVVVPTIEDCYRALGAIHGTWRPLPGRIKDYIAFPKPNGYKSIHTTIFTGDGGIIEVQIRTIGMHREAEYGIASRLSYKERSMDEHEKKTYLQRLLYFIPFVSRYYKDDDKKSTPTFEVPHWIKDITEMEKESGDEGEFMENLKTDSFNDRVFAFTPIGDVVDLPIDSSPIDFAYAIHSDIGNHIGGSKVNGKLVSLDTPLQNGDIVEIVVKESAKPSAKWLELAKTASAKRKIRTALGMPT